MPGHKIGEPKHLFTRIDDETIEAQIQKLNQSSENPEPTPVTINEPKIEIKEIPIIDFEDFMKLDLKTGTINTAEKVNKSDKLLKLTVDIGTEIRDVVSGIAQFFTPEEIIGKKIVLLTNLKPRKIKGIESNGMILMAEDNEGKLYFVSPDELAKNGSTVK